MSEHQDDSRTDDGGALPLEAPAPSLEACPSCGAPLRDAEALLCIRCGYDLRTLAQTETRTGHVEAPVLHAGDEPPLVRPGRGGPWTPVVLAALALGVMLWGLLSGRPGLFPLASETVTEIPWPDRWVGAARLPVLIGLWCVCGLVSLGIASWVAARPFGDVRLAAARVVAVVTIASTVRFVTIPSRLLEFLAEAGGQALVSIALCLLLFRLTVREAAAVLVLSGAGFFVITVVAHFVAWAT